MGRSLIGFYALAVCFCTLMCLMIALGVGAYSVVRLAVPEFTIASSSLEISDQQFLIYYPDKKDLPAAERAKIREEQQRLAIQYERRSALQTLVWVAIIATIDGVVYALHWRLARRAEPIA